MPVIIACNAIRMIHMYVAVVDNDCKKSRNERETNQLLHSLFALSCKQQIKLLQLLVLLQLLRYTNSAVRLSRIEFASVLEYFMFIGIVSRKVSRTSAVHFRPLV